MKKSFIYPIIFMAVITIVFTSVLAFLNYKTIDAIEYNEKTDLRRTILYVFDIEPSSQDPEAIEETFKEYIEEEENEDRETIYSVKENDEITAYAFPVNGIALWGTVEGFAAVSSDYDELLGLDFVSHSETPGLGGRIDEESFKKQFRGLDLDSEDGKYIVYNPAPNGNVDSIAGATQTSDSVSKFVNKEIFEFIKKRKGAN